MIVYLADKTQFLEDVDSNRIEDRIARELYRSCRRSVGPAEVNAWRNSMQYMQRILQDEEIPHDAGVAIEFGIPQTAKRIDFVLTGKNSQDRPTAIIVELKQWTEVKPTNKDAIVKTFVGGTERETEHPSYQAWSYAALLEDYNETVREREIALNPCSYLHNCITDSTINSPFYSEHTRRAPAFVRDDAAKLRAFIKKHVKHGDSGDIIYQIRDGRIRPSKNLADCLVSLLQGNREFLMIDDQKLVYETALHLADVATADSKRVLIVQGGPGTGKSVVAINLLVELTARSKVVQYVTRNSAPRAVYEAKLAGSFVRSRISNLFKGSGSYTDTEPNSFDALIVDEAHRLNEKSGMFQNLGENQIKEIINSAKCAVFFIDDYQRVTFKDIGTRSEIQRWAESCGASVEELALESQFRCNGSEGYLAWVENTLQIRPTAHPTMEGVDFDLVVCDSPGELRARIIENNQLRNKARLVAGYCWDWHGKKDSRKADIELLEHDFRAKWNLASDGMLWILKPESVGEIGCIHTCQGLELDYVGVLLGPDFVVRNGTVQTDATKRSKMDASVKGYKAMLKKSPRQAKELADQIIKNTYRTLMTRGQKGCFVFSTDPETNEFLKLAAQRTAQPGPIRAIDPYATLPLRLVPEDEVDRFRNAVPLFNLQIAAGKFSEQWVDDCDWVELPDPFVAREGYFVTRVVGESMNRRIPNGSWCLFKASPGGSREGKVVLVQHRDIQDPDHGGQFTVKIYHSEKRQSGDSWEHVRIVLTPDSTVNGFREIVLDKDSMGDLSVRGELVAVLGQR